MNPLCLYFPSDIYIVCVYIYIYIYIYIYTLVSCIAQLNCYVEFVSQSIKNKLEEN